MQFARHRSIGFVMDMGIAAFDIQKQGVDSKRYERFVREQNITPKEYKEVYETLIENLYDFYKGKDDESKFIESLFDELKTYYHQYQDYNETMFATQKQLDYITLLFFFIPFTAQATHYLTLRYQSQPLLIDRILPDTTYTAIQKALLLIQNDIDLTKILHIIHSKDTQTIKTIKPLEIIKALIMRALKENSEYAKGDDTIRKNIAHWLADSQSKERVLPAKESLQNIAEISRYCKSFSKDKLYNLLCIARALQYMYDEAIKYFGEDLTNLAIKHFRLINTIILHVDMFAMHTQDVRSFDNFLTQHYQSKVSKEAYQSLCRYLDWYIDASLFNVFLEFHADKESFTPQKGKILKKMFARYTEIINPLLMLTEENFFQHIEVFLPVNAFSPKECSVELERYMEATTQSFYNPNSTKIKNLSSQELESLFNIEPKEDIKLMQEAYFLTQPGREKELGDKERLEAIFKELDSISKTEDNPYIAFPKARFYAQMRDFDNALKYYLKSLEFGKGVLGRNYRYCIKEGLMIAAQSTRKKQVDLHNAKSDFTKFYKEAYFAGLIDENIESLKQYFLTDEKKKFDLYFTHLFSKSIIKSNAKKKSKAINISPNFSIALRHDFDSIKIDFANPNKWLKEYPNPITQLMHCCAYGDIESVKKLIEAGADVNMKKKNDNATALIYTIPDLIFNEPSQQHIEIAQTLIPKMSKEAINARLVKKKETALSLSMYYGLDTIVKLLLENGADPNLKHCTMGDMTALYWCIQLISCAKGNHRKITPFRKKPFSNADIKNMAKTMPLNATFDDELLMGFQNVMQSDMREFYEIMMKEQDKFFKSNVELYYRVFDILLPYCDVNIPQENLYNISPLMFATELNEVELVKKLLGRGADKNHKNSYGKSAYDYACVHYNIELMRILQ